MRYKYLIFDLYGTLTSIHTEENEPEVWEKLSLFYGYHGASYTPRGLRRSFMSKLGQRNMKAGQSYEGYPDMPVLPVFEELFTDKKVKSDTALLADEAAQLFRICSTKHIKLYPNVKKALRKLKKSGFGLYLLSNAQAAYTRRELKLLGIERSFDAVYLSSDYGMRKPAPGFIGTLLRSEGLDPSQCLMIGNDMDTDIRGAKAAGVDGLFVLTGMEQGETVNGSKADYRFEGNDWDCISDYIAALSQADEQVLTADE